MKAARPTSMMIMSDSPSDGASQRASSTANTPLPTSPSSVNSAAFLLPVRSTLVAPGLPEP